MYSDTLATGIESLQRREKIANVAMYATMAIYALTALGEILQLAGVIDIERAPDESLVASYGLLMITSSVIFALSAIAVAVWIYRAHANLREAAIPHLEFTPGWAVGWYIVPIATYFKPYQAMRELWWQSHLSDGTFTTEAPSLLKTWWGLWVVSILLGNVSNNLLTRSGEGITSSSVVLSLVSSLCTIGAAWMLREIVSQITTAQVDGLSVAHVFE